MCRTCKGCGKKFTPRPQRPDQQFCSTPKCQRERKCRWQAKKRAEDPDYRQNQAESQSKWVQRNAQYWREYRRTHPEYTQTNRVRQRWRDQRRRQRTRPHLAKMDLWNEGRGIISGTYQLLPVGQSYTPLAKMDVCLVQLVVLPQNNHASPVLQRDDFIANPVDSG